jgi:hypothetical protein
MTKTTLQSLSAALVLVLLSVGFVYAQPGQDPVPLHASIIDHPSPGYLFVTPMGQGSYAEICSDSGQLLYYFRSQLPVINFQVQPGKQLSYFSPDSNGFVILDSKYNFVTTVRSKNGNAIDVHDFLILPNGHYLFLTYDTVQNYDVSNLVGEPTKVSAIGVVIQELDQDQNLVFQWRGFDEGNFVPEDMQHPEMINNGQMDAIHANSLDVDSVGNILLSSRHLSEITKIDHKTGQIIWRLGGKHNQFTFIGDSIGFSYQHSARFVSPNHVLLFDNGNFHTPHFSRAVEYEIDEQAHTAKLVWQFDHNKTIASAAMGNVQRLPNGNTMIGWGAADPMGPAATEVRPDGSIAYEASLGVGYMSYRVFRFPWGDAASVARALNADFMVSPLAPNPSIGSTTFAVNLAQPVAVTIDVFDESGRLMQSVADGILGAGERRFEIDAHAWPSGVYKVVVKSAKSSIVQNFIR